MGAVTRWLHGREHIQLLLHWRWLVLLIAIPISLVIELFEGTSVGLHLLDEVILDGLILPLTTWVVLTFAAQKIAGQFKREADLERRQRFTQQLAEHREYYELAQFVVRFPAEILPVAHAALSVMVAADDTRLEPVAEWSSPAAGAAARRDGQGSTSGTAARGEDRGAHAYCLILVHEQQQVGSLRLRWRPGEQPADDALALITALAPEIAAALSRAIADTAEAARAYHEAQAFERRRITQELHDSLAQQVFYLNLSLDQLADDQTIAANEALQRKLASMRDVAADVYEQIRNNLAMLRAWEQVDLSEAVSELARATARSAELSIAVDVQGEPGWLSPHTCENLYSAVREALNNVVKHARARHVQLVMTWLPERLAISVADDGAGFDAQLTPDEGHYGLTLMRETIESLGGKLTLASTPGRGTTVQIAIPISQLSPTLQARQGMAQQLRDSFGLAV